MARMIAGLLLLLAVFICGTIAEEEETKEIVSHNYVSLDTASLTHKHQAYVPVNLPQKKAKRGEKVVLKVRNTSFTDSIYLSRVKYYDAKGDLLSNIIDSALLIKPMATGEIMVKSNKFEDMGDNFIVEWYTNSTSKPIVHAILMNGSNVVMSEQGILIPDELSTIN